MNENLFVSPCIGICTIDKDTQNCIGCGRTQDQIREWTIYTDKQRDEIIKEIQLNRCQVLSNN